VDLARVDPSAPGPGASVEVCELFESIAGESSQAGQPALFIRLAGCNLRCSWCDTRYALEAGTPLPIARLVELTRDSRCRLVIVTGGEPLHQAATGELCSELLAAGKRVQVETNGSLDTSVLPKQVQVVLDMKPPSSGESERMDLANLARLGSGDNLKIIVADRADFDWAANLVTGARLAQGVVAFLSPAAGLLEARVLAGWLLAAGLDARLQIQLHRLLWPQGREGRPIPLPQTP